MTHEIMRFERIARRGGSSPIVRIQIDGNIYSFELEDGIILGMVTLLAGGPRSSIDLAVDVIRKKCQKGGGD